MQINPPYRLVVLQNRINLRVLSTNLTLKEKTWHNRLLSPLTPFEGLRMNGV
jgi:hypothetical protein